MCLIFPMMESFGNFFKDGHGSNIVVKIKEFNQTKTKEDQIALPSFKDIDVSRYLSYGYLAEVLVNCDDFIMPYLKELVV
jgi:hypothetical protein